MAAGSTAGQIMAAGQTGSTNTNIESDDDHQTAKRNYFNQWHEYLDAVTTKLFLPC